MDVQIFAAAWLWWFLIGVGLFFLELFLPGFIVLFFGIGCLLTAAALMVFDMSLTWQIVLFMVSSLASLLLLRTYFMRVFAGRTNSAEDEYDDFPTGARVPVIATIDPPNSGRIRHRGSPWDAVADERIEEGETAVLVEYADASKLVFRVAKQ